MREGGKIVLAERHDRVARSAEVRFAPGSQAARAPEARIDDLRELEKPQAFRFVPRDEPGLVELEEKSHGDERRRDEREHRLREEPPLVGRRRREEGTRQDLLGERDVHGRDREPDRSEDAGGAGEEPMPSLIDVRFAVRLLVCGHELPRTEGEISPERTFVGEVAPFVVDVVRHRVGAAFAIR